jgi:hypothetical protein
MIPGARGYFGSRKRRQPLRCGRNLTMTRPLGTLPLVLTFRNNLYRRRFAGDKWPRQR